jgi:serine O-acetyltransferase
MLSLAKKFLEINLKRIFSHIPVISIEMLDHYLNEAIRQTIIDANIKYAGKISVESWTDLQYLIDTDTTIEAVFLYRLERLIYVNEGDSLILHYLAGMMKRRTGCEIYYSTHIGPGLNVQHGFGIVIGPRYKIGENFTIHQGVTLGQKNLNSPNEIIEIGDNVTIFANAVVLGNIKIGNNVRIGANSVLLTDADENSVYVGAPAQKKGQ